MYTPAQFAETRLPVLHAFVRSHPFATIVSGGSNGLQANHIPLLLQTDRGSLGTLQGHIARGNSMWQDVPGDAEVLALFQGADHYVSPNWYPSKRQHGKVVPTWNYAVVHAHGRITWIHDPGWLRSLLDSLTARHERNQASPWHVADAPAEYVDSMIAAIVGFEIAITRITGKWKVSQNRNQADRAGVVSALTAQKDDSAREMAGLIEQAGHRSDS